MLGLSGNPEWSGYDPVTDQVIVRFVYESDVVGQLTGVADWSTRLAGPQQWNQGGTLGATGWPIGASPVDSRYGYDGLNRLASEDRKFATGTGEDYILDPETRTLKEARGRSFDWTFDRRGSMATWEETSSSGVSGDSWGRALGDIKNGYELNVAKGEACAMSAWATETGVLPDRASCFIPDALYFASNTRFVEPGRGTCVWVEYDLGGRMTKQTQRTGCTSCAFVPGDTDYGVNAASCPGAPEVGTPGTLGYKPEVESKRTMY